MNTFLDNFWKIVSKICYIILKFIFGNKFSKKLHQTFMQFIKFGIVGVSNTLISYIVYVLSLLLLQNWRFFSEIDYLLAQLIQFLLSVLWSFYWNNKVVFIQEKGKKRSIWKTLIKTYISYSFTGLCLNSILLILWVQVIHISEFVAPIINLLVSVPLNFVINKYWAFKQK